MDRVMYVSAYLGINLTKSKDMLFSVLSKNYWMSYRYFDFWFLFLNSRCFFFRFRISGRLEHDSGKFQGKVKR